MRNKEIKVRFAPSPTGPLHVGSARTALFNYLFAKKYNGQIFLRIDDTDKERSKKEFEENILEGLAWMGLSFDETYYQSERGEIYASYINKMIENGSAYVSKEEVKKEGDRAEVIRFKNPNKEVVFKDLIRGDIKFQTEELGDFVIAKDINTPLYHLGSVIDDALMNITHIIRGEDHISNTPRQILMIEAIGSTVPEYAHIPLILAPDRSKLSKRHGATPVLEYREQGYFPEAFNNFIALLGWSPQATTESNKGSDEEILSMEELIEKFDLSAIKKGGSIFNIEKLKWINREHLLKKDRKDILAEVKKNINKEIKDELLEKIFDLALERAHTVIEIGQLIESSDFEFFFKQPNVSKELLKDPVHLKTVIELLKNLDDKHFQKDKIKEAVWDFATETGRGLVLWPMRTALTGQERSPDPFTVAEIIGKEETLKRLETALKI